MSGSINKVILVGNLGRDPEVKQIPSGKSMARFSIATSENYKDKSGQKQEKTEWHNIVVWDKLAEICGQYLHKGTKVYLEGKIQSRPYEKDGVKHTSFEIVGNQMTILSPRDSDSAAPAGVNPGKTQDASPEINSDDIPF